MAGKPNLSVEEVARWLDVDPRTVYRLLQRGKLPAFKAGGQWRFNEEILKAWVAEQVTMEWLKIKDGSGSLKRSANAKKHHQR